MYRQLLPHHYTQFDVLQAGRKRGLVEGDGDLLLESVDVFYRSWTRREHFTAQFNEREIPEGFQPQISQRQKKLRKLRKLKAYRMVLVKEVKYLQKKVIRLFLLIFKLIEVLGILERFKKLLKR